MTVVINMHKPYFIFKTYVMSWLWRCHASLMHTPSSKVLPTFFPLLWNTKEFIKESFLAILSSKHAIG